MIPVLKQKYLKEIVPALQKEMGIKSPMGVPRLLKIVVNMGVGAGAQDSKIMQAAVDDLKRITGQAPSVRLSKRSEASFKIRQGVPVGCMVTLRKNRMYEFLERLIGVAMPRVRDFKGLNLKSFDGTGNYSFGIVDQTIFIEVPTEKIDKVRGMDVIINTSAKNDEDAFKLLKALGLPFQRKGN